MLWETLTSAGHSSLKRELCVVFSFGLIGLVHSSLIFNWNSSVLWRQLFLMCVLSSSFQTSPPSLHALVGLCVIGCLTLDLTLLQTALLEMNKIVGKTSTYNRDAACVCMSISRVEELGWTDTTQLLPTGPQDYQAL